MEVARVSSPLNPEAMTAATLTTPRCRRLIWTLLNGVRWADPGEGPVGQHSVLGFKVCLSRQHAAQKREEVSMVPYLLWGVPLQSPVHTNSPHLYTLSTIHEGTGVISPISHHLCVRTHSSQEEVIGPGSERFANSTESFRRSFRRFADSWKESASIRKMKTTDCSFLLLSHIYQTTSYCWPGAC